MSKTLLVIQGYKSAQERIHRHWPYYERAGVDILGVGRTDNGFPWPKSPRLIATVNIGRDGYVQRGDLNGLLLGCLAHCLSDKQLEAYDDFCVIENDAIFVRALPVHPGGLVTTMAGHHSAGDGFKGQHYFHTPWWVDRATAQLVTDYGTRMRAAGLQEGGFPDRFVGLMIDIYGLKWIDANSFSVNCIDRPEYASAARAAIRNGAYYVHGIKSAQQLKDVTEDLL